MPKSCACAATAGERYAGRSSQHATMRRWSVQVSAASRPMASSYIAHFLGADSAGKLINGTSKSPRTSAASMFPHAAADRTIFYDTSGRAQRRGSLRGKLTWLFDSARDVARGAAGRGRHAGRCAVFVSAAIAGAGDRGGRSSEIGAWRWPPLHRPSRRPRRSCHRRLRHGRRFSRAEPLGSNDAWSGAYWCRALASAERKRLHFLVLPSCLPWKPRAKRRDCSATISSRRPTLSRQISPTSRRINLTRRWSRHLSRPINLSPRAEPLLIEADQSHPELELMLIAADQLDSDFEPAFIEAGPAYAETQRAAA